MSGAHLEGRMPRPEHVIGVLDDNAKRALTEAKQIALPLVAQEAPGRLGSAFEASVRRTKTGYRTVLQAPRRKRYRTGPTVAAVARYVTHGTGIHRTGPGRKRPITGRKGVLGTMVLPGGRKVRSVKGQKPNAFFARAETRALAPVQRALHDGAKHAADALRRL